MKTIGIGIQFLLFALIWSIAAALHVFLKNNNTGVLLWTIGLMFLLLTGIFRESEANYKALIQSVNDSIISTDSEGRILLWNRASENMFGFSREEAIGAYLKPLIFSEPHSDDLQFLPFFPSGDSISLKELSIPSLIRSDVRNKDGKVFPAEISASRRKGKWGQIITFIIKDITNYIQIENQIRIRHERLKAAEAVGHVGSWEYDLVTSIFWGSDESFCIYGLEPSPTGEISFDKIAACIPDREILDQALVDLIRDDKSYDLEFAIHPGNGENRKFVRSVARLLKDKKGNPVKVTGNICDITRYRDVIDEVRRTRTACD